MTRTSTERRVDILVLIEKYRIETQQELTDRLNAMGHGITQATVSRDITELGLVKVPDETRTCTYYSRHDGETEKFRRMFMEARLTVKSAENLVVVRTVSGSASTAATFIDKLDDKNILGTIAGDDTILVIVKSKEATADVVKKLSV